MRMRSNQFYLWCMRLELASWLVWDQRLNSPDGGVAWPQKRQLKQLVVLFRRLSSIWEAWKSTKIELKHYWSEALQLGGRNHVERWCWFPPNHSHMRIVGAVERIFWLVAKSFKGLWVCVFVDRVLPYKAMKWKRIEKTQFPAKRDTKMNPQ